LVLVPDVGRLTRLAHLLGKPLPDRLATLYSELPVRRRASEWRRIQTGQATVVVGTRAALYAPLPSPEWVIVFEEQDSSYHLEESPKTHLRNLALARAKGCGGRAVLISSSPSVETDFHARTGDYEPLTLADRDTQPAPEIHTQPTGPRLCSDALSRAIGETLACGERVVLLLNRRGFSPAFVCPDCGEGFRCTRCSLSLVFHQAQRSMRCHACGLSQPPPVFCRRCRGTRLLTIGGGTERLEEELRRTFPNAPAVRLDGDTLRTPTQRKRWALEINEATADILIGTQLLFHVPLPDRIGLFGVLQADDPLHLPDYRAAEWCFLRLCRVLDKAAQAAPPARVLVQAFQPDHYLFTALAGGRRESFYDEELRLREALGFPPYATLLRLQFIGGTEGRVAEEAERFGKQLARRLDPSPGTDLLGPAPAPRRHIRGNYRYQILLKARSRYALLETIRKSLPALKGGLRSVKLEVDLDPASLL
jgi:primosomal protein N' (replication factor Y)